MNKNSFSLIKGSIVILGLLLLILTACNMELNTVSNDKLNAAQELYNKFVAEGSIIEVGDIVQGESGVKEIEFAGEEAESAFENTLVNEIGMPKIFSEDSNVAGSRASITLSGHVSRTWAFFSATYRGSSTASDYTPSKIKVTIYAGSSSNSKTETNSRSASTSISHAGWNVPQYSVSGKHECWYNFGQGYLVVYTAA